MRVAILPRADRDLNEIYDWIAEDDPDAAARHVRRLTTAALSLRDFPMCGMARPEIGEGARSLVVGRYLVLYRVNGERVEIVRFVHGAQEVGGLWAQVGAVVPARHPGPVPGSTVRPVQAFRSEGLACGVVDPGTSPG